MLAVTILGNNSALPMHDRHPTSQVITTEDHLFLVDCGEGTQIQMNRYKIRRSRINHIFISHLHGDHYFGLPGLLNSFNLTSRTEPLHIYAPAPLKEILDLQFKVGEAHLSYSLHFHPLGEPGLLVDERKITVHSFKVRHRIPCWGFLFREKPKPRKVDPDKAVKAGVPTSFYPHLKEGEDYTSSEGILTKNEEVTKPSPPSYSYAYTADTSYDESIAEIVKGCGLLYHEATYLDEMRERARERFHSTAKEAATIAKTAGVKKLILGHFSSKYEELDAFRQEAELVFPEVELAKEGVTYVIR
ncbi:ribonuclease Z [Pollutibacter soli]|uniref:ribonuclease Z n=1 Tax=Pollutibacter soli TaxID=3034157 RepID=UPI003013F582